MDAICVPICVWISQGKKTQNKTKNPNNKRKQNNNKKTYVALVRIWHSSEYEILWKIPLTHLSAVKLAEEFSGGDHGITTAVAFCIFSALPPLGLLFQSLLPPHSVPSTLNISPKTFNVCLLIVIRLKFKCCACGTGFLSEAVFKWWHTVICSFFCQCNLQGNDR